MSTDPKREHKLKWRPPGPVAASFFKSKAFIRGIRGPIGSAKSTTCVMRLFTTALTQAPGLDGVRRTRFAVIRNTYPELTSTTIKTWLDWFPENVFGKMTWDVPITHHIKLPLPDGTSIDMEVMFVSADRPEDAKKLLSMELTAAYINEAREIVFEIVEALTGRVGRYPAAKDRPPHIPKNEWPTEVYVCMDTNSPNTGSWWHTLAEPSAKGHDELMERMQPIIDELVKMGVIQEGQALMEFFSQPSGLSKEAENLDNLRPGYYQFSSLGKTKEWINVHIKNEYGVTMSGKRVYDTYSDDLHLAKAKLFPIKGVPLGVSFDFGLTPAFVAWQLTPTGQFRVLAELWAEHMSLLPFLENVVVPFMSQNFPQYDRKDVIATGDPSGDAGRDTRGESCEDILLPFFPQYESAYSNDLPVRLNAVDYFLGRLANREPAFRLSPECPILHEGFLGGYHYRKLNTADVRYLETPDKNRFSHLHDALQYAAMRAYKPVRQAPRRRRGVTSGADRSTGY